MAKQPEDNKVAMIMRNGMLLPNPARNGRPKAFRKVEIGHGMTRQTKPSHAFLHGAPGDDETNEKLGYGVTVPVHPGMVSQTPATRGLDAGPNAAGDHLRSASILEWEKRHVDIRPAGLPSKNRGR